MGKCPLASKTVDLSRKGPANILVHECLGSFTHLHTIYNTLFMGVIVPKRTSNTIQTYQILEVCDACVRGYRICID